MDGQFGMGEDASFSMLYFCFLYEQIPLGEMARSSMIRQYHHLIQTRPIDKADVKMDFLGGCAYDTMPVRESRVYQESNTNPILIQKAVDGMLQLSDKDILFVLSLIDRLQDNR